MMSRSEIADHDGACIVVAGDSPMLQSSSIKTLLDDYQESRPACILGTLIHEKPHRTWTNCP